MFRIISDRLIVKADPRVDETTSKGGIVLIQKAELPLTGEVVSVGDGRDTVNGLLPVRVNVGDRVMYSKHGGTNFTYNGTDYVSMREHDIIVIFDRVDNNGAVADTLAPAKEDIFLNDTWMVEAQTV